MKSRVNDFYPLIEALFHDASKLCGANRREVRRDLSTISRRLRDEGLSFITITLPEFGKSFEKSLSQMAVRQCDFLGWKFAQGLPCFLKGFLCDIFDSQTGGLLDEPKIEAIRSTRQIALCFKKLGLACAEKRERKAVEGYVHVERSLRDAMLPVDDTELYSSVSNLLWGNMFRAFNSFECIPKHGPGAVVEGFTPNSKWSFDKWYQRAAVDFPFDWFACVNASELADGLRKTADYVEVQDKDEQPMKMALVPKTLKGPRIIAISACCMQYLQQAIKDWIIPVLEHDWITGGHINFTDQTVNQRMAMTASQTGLSATLDLSEASDRVLMSLVRVTFSSCKDLLHAFESTREDVVQLPTLVKINENVAIRKLRLKKFAGMGSAVCFPVEAMVFFTLIVTALIKERKLPVTLRNIYDVSRDVYVYGDDLIVPVDEAPAICGFLERFHCRVNSGKSFWTGNFRESCGVDAYAGKNVTPVYVRATWPTSSQNAHECQSLVATGNQFYEKGFIQTAKYIRSRIEGALGPLPCCQDETFSGLQWTWSTDCQGVVVRVNETLQRQEILSWTSSPSYFDDPIDGYAALLKSLSGLEKRDRNYSLFKSGKKTGSFTTTVILNTVGQRSSTPKFRIAGGITACDIESRAELTILRWVRKIVPERSERHGASTLKRRWVGATCSV